MIKIFEPTSRELWFILSVYLAYETNILRIITQFNEQNIPTILSA